MTTINIMGYDFEINMSQNFCKQGRKKAKELEAKFKELNITADTDLNSLGDRAVELVEAYKDFLFWMLGRDAIIEKLGGEITINKFIKFGNEANQKMVAALPKESVMTKKIKL